MSLYREPRGRRIWPLALTAIVAAAIGLGLGLLLSPDEEEPSVAAAVEGLRGELAPALSALELVTIEYPQAVERGEVVAEIDSEADPRTVDRLATGTRAALERALGG